MRKNPIPLITALLFVLSAYTLQGQKPYSLHLKSGTVIPDRNITDEQLSRIYQSAAKLNGKNLIVIQFEQFPTEAQKTELRNNGIELISYIPNNAYSALVTGLPAAEVLSRNKAVSVFELSPVQKMDGELAAGIFPARAVKISGTVDVWISYVRLFSLADISEALLAKGFSIISSQHSAYGILILRVPQQMLHELAALPFVEYVQLAPGEPQLLNNVSSANSRAKAIGASAGIGRNLKGEGVTIGIGDDGDPQHVDMSGRKYNHTNGYYNYHCTHVSGIAAGAGIWNELYTGHAPKAKLVSQLLGGIITNSPAYVNDYGMVITNNSWGLVDDCSYMGQYDLYSSVTDQQAFTLPSLQHVFAAGNSGWRTCSPYPPAFKTVYNAFQSAKNLITVGNVMSDGTISSNSSRGPVLDGRIKPEIVAQGNEVWSSANFIDYWRNSGTSMAAPSVSGGLALLYQRYRQLNASANPANGLMKAIVCNVADDKGNPGPDFTYGFGQMNLLRAVETIENNRYFTGTVGTGSLNTHNITVPPNTAALKVMLYWNDPVAAAVSSRALVNNLDLTVTTVIPPAVYQPLILDASPANVNNNAVQGVDTLNNIEQVTITAPAAGTYTINVNGAAVPVNSPQQYFVAYDIVPVSSTLTYPVGGEKFLPGETVLLMWDSYGGNAESFTAEYSLDNGGNWITISNSIGASLRQYAWVVPAGAFTNQALIRVTKNNTAQVSTSAVFTIIGAPALQLAPASEQCEGYIKLNWTAVPNATQYEVMKLQGDEMQSVAILPNTTFTYTFSGLSKDSVYWVTARAIYNGNPGRRDTAVNRQPNSGTCTGSISDNDIKTDVFLSPSSGRMLTSTQLGNNVPVTIRIKNLDDVTTSGDITAQYRINGGAVVTETITNPAITAGSTYDYTFTTVADLSAVGVYTLEAWAKYTGDPVALNDTIKTVVKQLPNPAVVLPFTDNLEAASVQTVVVRQIGLQGLDRYDFANSSAAGRLRTFINSGMAFSGNRAITLDADKYIAANTDSLTGTFNLAAYNANTQDVRFDFRYKNHGQYNHASNKLWIRGSDADTWIEAYDLAANQNEVDGSYKLSSSVQLSDILKNAVPAQNFTTSFQVRWGQYGQLSAADNDGSAGYTFDDIQLYTVTDDMQLVSIDTPIVNSCNLSAAVPVRITVRNNSESALTNIPVQYSINGGPPVIETITATIPANSNYQYTFAVGANLAAAGNYLVAARVAYLTDSYNVNDTVSRTVVNTPLITVTNTNPYLEQFETGSGNWYTGGKNSSWEYGTPASYKVTRAANGSKAWKTGLQGKYKDAERSYLYSPCFDISAVANPALSMSISLDLEDCGAGLCDGAYMEYSKDGVTWQRLGANGQGTNWYNKAYAGNNLWSVENYYRWHVATLPLSVLPAPLSQYTRLQFRFAVTSDIMVNREGVAIDDIHIYSNTGIYDGTGASPVVAQPAVNGNNWVHFVEGGTGKIIASVNPDGQNMGNTEVQSFVNTAGVRNNSGQYYHDRNITIKPANNTLADSCTVRFYFLDTETEALLAATGCGTCYKPSMAYELGVSKYSDVNDFYEDGIVENGISGVWLYINPAKVKKIPYDRGYYAEFRVKDFSEFWLNNGGFDNNHPLPLQISSFSATRSSNEKDAVLNWVTASEFEIARFDIEVAKGNEDFNRNHFVKTGSVSSKGNSATEQSYSFTDFEMNKNGVWYYRLKIVEKDGSSSYSVIRPVSFTNETMWQVSPNPSNGNFRLAYQLQYGENAEVKMVDASGKTVKQYNLSGSGFLQKLVIDISGSQFANGLYLLDIFTGGKHKSFKLLKQ